MGPFSSKQYYVLFQRGSSIINNYSESDNDDYEPNDSEFSLELLPEDILLKFFISLPAVDGIRIGSVSKQWQDRSKSSCTQPNSVDDNIPRQLPWYFVFKECGQGDITGFAYDSDIEFWRKYDFPYLKSIYDPFRSAWLTPNRYCFSSSNGLVCAREIFHPNVIFICNPMLKCGKRLPDISSNFDRINVNTGYVTIALSVDIKSKSYNIAMVKYCESEITTLALYDSKKNSWIELHVKTITNSRGTNQCIICNKMLYYVIEVTDIIDSRFRRHVLLAYDYVSPKKSTNPNFIEASLIEMPCALYAIKLINICDKLIIVGEKVKRNIFSSDVEICIWELHKKKWKKVTRMPYYLMKSLSPIDVDFVSVSDGDFIYIQSYHTPLIMTIFNFRQKVWELIEVTPLRDLEHRRLGYINGFCFEPRLDIRP